MVALIYMGTLGRVTCGQHVFSLQGSTVNMNIMGWLYSKMEAALGSVGPTTLGVTLLIGE